MARFGLRSTQVKPPTSMKRWSAPGSKSASCARSNGLSRKSSSRSQEKQHDQQFQSGLAQTAAAAGGMGARRHDAHGTPSLRLCDPLASARVSLRELSSGPGHDAPADEGRTLSDQFP